MKKRNNKINKKGQIEVSFHWIFILIAGGVILGFFLILTMRQKDAATEDISRSVSGRLDSILSTVQQNPDSTQPLSNLGVVLQFDCAQDGHTYQVEGGTSKTYLESEIIFTPRIVGGSNTMVRTKTYYSPYPVVQILYFSDEKTQYIFTDSMSAYYQELPDQFEKNLTTLSELANREDSGFRKYIIIIKDDAEEIKLQPSVAKKSTIIKVNTNSKKIKFVDGSSKSNSEVEKPYINDETLFGAIISGDEALYGCTMEKLMKTSRIVGEINLNRVDMLKNDASLTSSKCKIYYLGVPQEYIQNIIGNSTYPPPSQSNNYNDLRDSMSSLVNLNVNIAKYGCLTVY